ncbi:hypothetical protein CDEST_00043 [Colletotrichum destructivum]|uniref:Uncharacterized protein n=1 Tax=Colletotrichum destructivum TaxID=34406 RepID=A0AAX4HVY7_9PEZI|nr:hypothetical protein CDEST_00043 [Colletotrichum destructivum]
MQQVRGLPSHLPSLRRTVGRSRRGDTAPARCKLWWHVVPGLTASDTCEIAPTVSSQERRDLPLRYAKECIADNTSRDTRCPHS